MSTAMLSKSPDLRCNGDLGCKSNQLPRATLVSHKPAPDAIARLICFHSGGSSSQQFGEWALQEPHIEVCCVELPGRGRSVGQPFFTDMRSAVNTIHKQISEVWLDKPFALFGDSVGAILAYCLALRLAEDGLTPLRLFVSGMAAPELAAPGVAPELHTASDQELLALAREAGLVKQVQEDDEMQELLLNPLRADIRLVESGSWFSTVASRSLNTPITAFRGSEDVLVQSPEMEPWAKCTGKAFDTKDFPGNHAYATGQRALVERAILERLVADMKHLPPSQMTGEKMQLELSIPDWISHWAKSIPEHPCLVEGDFTLTFADFDRLTRRFAGLLTSKVKLGECVGCYMSYGSLFAVTLFACIRAGAVFMLIDTGNPEDLILQNIALGMPALIVTDRDVGDSLFGRPSLHVSMAVLQQLGDQMLEAPLPKTLPTDRACINFSSGTTGKPKGMPLTQAWFLHSAHTRTELFPYSCPTTTRYGLGQYFFWEVWRPLLTGVTGVIVPRPTLYDPDQFIDFIAQNLTHVMVGSTLLEQLLATGNLSKAKDLREISSSGEMIPTRLASSVLAELPNTSFIAFYSLVEGGDLTSVDFRTDLDRVLSPLRSPAGTVHSGSEITIRDENFDIVGTGLPGELFVRGVAVISGYLGGVEQDRFVDINGEQWLRTGDSGRILSNGQLEILGRTKYSIKLRGFNVSLTSIQFALERHPQVSVAAVLPDVDPMTLNVTRILAAVILVREGRPGTGTANSTVSPSELRRWVAGQLPAAFVPEIIGVVESLPFVDKSGTSKLDSAMLLKMLREIPQHEVSEEAEEEELSTEERRFRDAFQTALGTAVRMDSDIFDLGLSSAPAIEVATSLRRHGFQVSAFDILRLRRVRAIFDHAVA